MTKNIPKPLPGRRPIITATDCTAALAEYMNARKLVACVTALKLMENPLRPIPECEREPFCASIGEHIRSGIGPTQLMASYVLLDHLVPDWASIDRDLAGRRITRDHRDVRIWRRAVLARDDHQCRACGSTSRLHAHHVIPWAKSPALRLFVPNGVALCQPCHKAQHSGTGLPIWH